MMDTLGNSETRKIGGNIPPEKEVQRCRKHDRKIIQHSQEAEATQISVNKMK